MYFKSYTCLTEHILVLRILYGAYSGTKVPVGITQIPYTEVPVGTTGLKLILPIWKYPKVLLRYYRTYTGIPELIIIQEYS